ncbi:unnamed protein product [Effrenium voratum]|uniref:SP-RING-type domain-containing protein n=1 Tax=Effrenium voratum TaxID=2562239 RepID=A0AA36MQ52_9DINO|nr:unnamed protein product [Effrenium voratum]
MAERNKLAALSLPLLQGLCRAKGIKAEKGDSKAELLARLERPSRKRRLVEEEAPAPQLKADVPVSRPVQMVFQSAVEVQSFRLLRCAYCSAIFNLEKTRYTGDPKRFWCPSCRFRAMDPFNEVGTDGVLHCSLLEGEICELVLHLPKLQEWREAGEAIWVRMLRLDSEELAQVWPEELAMEGHRRRDVPQDITAWLQAGPNALRLRFVNGGGLALGLVRARGKGVRRLVQEVPRQEPLAARAALLTLLHDEAQDGIEFVASRQLSLVCPLALERVERPARGRRCRHLRCFGVAAYCRSNYGMAAFNNRWSCPVCGSRVGPEDLLVDGFVEQILLETEADCEEAVLAPDGSWRPAETSPDDEKLRGESSQQRRGRVARMAGTNGYYHAGTEIWFPSGDYEGNVMCHYRECVRPPRSEDMSCSDGLTWPRSAVVMDHHRYWDAGT